MIRFLLVVLAVIGAWFAVEFAGGVNIPGQEKSAVVARLNAGLEVAIAAAKLNSEQTGSPERDSPAGLASHTAGATMQAPSGAAQRFPKRAAVADECEPSAVLPPDFVVEIHACTMDGTSCLPSDSDQASLANAPRWLRLTFATPAVCGTRGDYAKESYKKFLLGDLALIRSRKGAAAEDEVLSPDRTGLWVRLP